MKPRKFYNLFYSLALLLVVACSTSDNEGQNHQYEVNCNKDSLINPQFYEKSTTDDFQINEVIPT